MMWTCAHCWSPLPPDIQIAIQHMSDLHRMLLPAPLSVWIEAPYNVKVGLQYVMSAPSAPIKINVTDPKTDPKPE